MMEVSCFMLAKKLFKTKLYPLFGLIEKKNKMSGPFKIRPNLVCNTCRIHLQKLGKSYKTKKCYISENTFLHSLPLNKIVLEWAINPNETIKSRIGSCLELTSKIWRSPTIPQKSAISPKIHIFAQHTPQ